MPIFKVTNEHGYWDGVHKHKSGTIVEIEPQDYDRLLCNEMEALDEQGKKDLAAARKRWAPKDANGKPLDIPRWLTSTSGDLNPHDVKDLEALTPRGARVVSAPPEIEKVQGGVVRPATHGA